MSKKEKKKRTNGGKIEKNQASSSLAKELEALKSENASLVCKYDSLARQYDKVVKSFACVAVVNQEKEVLEEKLGKLIVNILPPFHKNGRFGPTPRFQKN
jgi:hypothetical protein